MKRMLFAAMLVGALMPVPAPAQTPPIKVGIISSITGPAANTGQQEVDGAMLAVELANKAGGIGGRMVEAVVFDDKYDAATAAVGMTQLASGDKVVGVAGSTGSASMLALIPVTERLKMPNVSFAAMSGKYLAEPPRWAFAMYPPANIESAAIVAHLQRTKHRKVAVIHDSVPYATTLRDAFAKDAAAAGLTIVATERYQPTDTDFRAQLIKIQAAAPDVLVQFGGSIPPAIIAKDRYQIGLKVPMVAGSPVFGVGFKKFVEIAGVEGTNGLVAALSTLDVYESMDPADPRTPVVRQFASAFKARFGREPVNYNGIAFDAMNLILDAVKRAGTDGAAVRDALEATRNFVGTTAIMSFSPSNHTGPTPESLVMATVKDGQLVALK